MKGIGNVLWIALCILLTGCGNQPQERKEVQQSLEIQEVQKSLEIQPSATREEPEQKTEEPKVHEGFKLRITTDPKEELVIPDPAEVSGVAEVTLFQNNRDLDINNLKGSALNSEYAYTDNHPFVSLPFLGLEETAIVTNYAVGVIGETKPRDITVDFEYSKKKVKQSTQKTIKGNCLVLTLWEEPMPEEEEEKYEQEDYQEYYDEDGYEEVDYYDGRYDDYAYLVVLDYENGTFYKTKTGILEDKQDQLNLGDLTGDGQDEIIVSGIANKWIIWEAFQLSHGEWKELKSDYYVDEREEGDGEDASHDMPYEAFDAKFINDNTIKVWCKDKDVGFKKEIDISDIATQEKAEGSYGKEVFVGDEVYFTNEKKFPYSHFQNIDPKSGICYHLIVEACYGHICGEIKAYIKYDKKTDKLKITKVKFKTVRK